jgi:dimethylargininase
METNALSVSAISTVALRDRANGQARHCSHVGCRSPGGTACRPCLVLFYEAFGTLISMTKFTRAIVRPPSPNFAEGLTTAGLGAPDYHRALEQHAAYCTALEQSGLVLTTIEPDPVYPDATFVEDTAVLTERCAVLARPGAPSRAGEATSIKKRFVDFYPSLMSIHAPGTLDGGDVCEAGAHFFIGISERTNETGARQLAECLAKFAYTATYVDIRSVKQILHLKSGLSFLGHQRIAVIEALADRAEFHGYDLVRVPAGEEYAVNCVLINDYVLLAAGYPKLAGKLEELGYKTTTLDMSEFRKMDGGLSCLSLRF